MVSEADEAAGLSPGNEENEAERCFSPEKPCLPLSIEGIVPQTEIFRKRGAEKCPKGRLHLGIECTTVFERRLRLQKK